MPKAKRKDKKTLGRISWAIKEFSENFIKDLLFSNSVVRRARIFFTQIFFPLLIKFFIFTLLFCFFGFTTLFILRPEKIENFYHKNYQIIKRYFDFDNYNYFKIEIEGANRTDAQKIIELVNDVSKNYDRNDELLVKILAKKIKFNHKWVEEVRVFRNLPNNLLIEIHEFLPFAIWQDGDEKFVIDKLGNKIKLSKEDEENYDFDDLIILTGQNANLNAHKLFNILTLNPTLSSRIYSATWVGNRRWNIRFENNILVKLPAKNASLAFKNLQQIFATKGALYNLKTVDLRIEDKTYLEYKFEN